MIALGTIKDKRHQDNIGAVKPDGVVNMDSTPQLDVEFGGISHKAKTFKLFFFHEDPERTYESISII